MDSKRIEELIAKYWECETTLEEEKELKSYFSSGEYDAKFKDIAPLFQYYTNEKESASLDGLFDEQVLAEIEQGVSSAPKKGRVLSMFTNISKVAAVILVVVVAGYFIQQEIKEKEQPYLTDTFEDPEKAFEETKKALQLISKNFNKGRKQAKKLSTFNEAQERVKENNL
ncbi:MAG: hypothetical protein RLO81_18040 [Fulvivirga sp.]|uniref:hypothetical protein n=1 Tax=Fulvivirga sp. TaxID=1931237 RepID=UPI0032EE5A34